MSEPEKKPATLPTVEFIGHISPPWSRDTVSTLIQLAPWKEGEPRRNFPDFALTQDALGVHVKAEQNVCLYPWSVVKRAVNVPRAK